MLKREKKRALIHDRGKLYFTEMISTSKWKSLTPKPDTRKGDSHKHINTINYNKKKHKRQLN